MPLCAFDSYDLIKEFRHAGFNEQQAEMQAHAAKLVFMAVVEQVREENNARAFASTRDVEGVESKLKTEINQVESKLKTEINQVETKLTMEINRVESHLMLEIEKVRRDLGQDILKSKNSMVMWMVTLFITQTGLFLGIYGKALDLI